MTLLSVGQIHGQEVKTLTQPLTPCWNWISINLSKPDMSIGTVLGFLTLTDGDYIKSQNESATWYDGFGWFGELTHLEPLKGYMLKVSHPETLIFPGCETTCSFIDARDGHEYECVTIGTQTWMAENLAWLPEISPSLLGTDTEPYYYVYGYEGSDVASAKATSNFSDYGVLYNWEAALASCPDGWHLPSDTEWTVLTDYLSNNGYGYDGSGDDIGKSMASTTLWQNNGLLGAVGNDQGSNNSSGFNAFPGGLCHYTGSFSDLGYNANFWSS